MRVDGPYRAVTPFEKPPAPDEGRNQTVEFDYSRDYTSAGVEHSCCACGEAILVTDEHVRATGWVDAKWGHRRRESKFCDRDCWTDWASQ